MQEPTCEPDYTTYENQNKNYIKYQYDGFKFRQCFSFVLY